VAQPALPGRADGERVGQEERALDRAELRELGESRRLSVRIHRVVAAEHLLLVEVPAVREDRRDAGSQPLALHDRPVADQHAGHVHERVQLPRGEAPDRIVQLT
jgi:hypothetical protein